MENSGNTLTIEDIAFRNHLKERNCLWLPVPLPVVSDVSSDVALWLFELRHLIDTSDTCLPDSVKLSADCDALLQELWTSEDDVNVLGEMTYESVSRSHSVSSVNKELNDPTNYDIVNPQTEIQSEKSEENCNMANVDENRVDSPSKPDIPVSKDENEENEHLENVKENCGLQNNDDIKLASNPENLKRESRNNNKITDAVLMDDTEENSQQSKNNTFEIQDESKRPSTENSRQNNTNTLCNKEEGNFEIQQNKNSVLQSAVNIKQVIEESNIKRSNYGHKVTRPHSYGGGELATYSKSHRSVACILWEANPLYSAVGDKGKEGNGRGFRKLCQSFIEELGNSITNSPGEHTSDSASQNYKSPVVQNEKVIHSFSDSTVNYTSNKCESESNPMHIAKSVDICTNAEVNSTHITGVCKNNIDFLQCKTEHETTDIPAVADEESNYGNADNLSMNTSITANKKTTKMSFDEQCEEVLNNLERVIQSLDVDDDDDSEVYMIEPDSDFLSMCKEADDLAEESIQQCPPVAPVIPKVTLDRSITVCSDLSDDVFVNTPSKEEGPVLFPAVTEVRRHRSLDINTIFDDGVTTPVPPARKKRSKDKDRYKTVPQISAHNTCVTTSAATKPLSEKANDKIKEDRSSVEELIPDNNFLNFENQPQELAIIKRVTDMTKEKRSVKVASQYEDANSCCQQCQTGECNLSTCSQNVALVPNPTCSTPNPTERVSISDENEQVLGINMTPLRPIFTVEFPPSENVCIEKRHSAIPILDDKSVNSCDDSGISLPSDSVLRCRKGSTSSDIEAWKRELQLSGLCYLDEELDINSIFQQEEWFSSNDSEGRIYFFEENSNESSWTLPEVRVTTCVSPSETKQTSKETKMGAKKPTKEEKQLEGDVQLRSDQSDKEPEAKSQYRMAKAHSVALLETSNGKHASFKFPRNWPQFQDQNETVLKEGTLNRTKITENGKKLRKNWAPARVVLTKSSLLFYKDTKSFAPTKNAQGEILPAQPEISLPLHGGSIEHGDKVSSRRHVLLVKTVSDLQVLLQCEKGEEATEEWYQAIQKAISDLPPADNTSPRNETSKLSPSPSSSRIGRSRSVKSKHSAKEIGSQEDLTVSADENQTKIKNRLKKFFHRRPTKEVLVKKGIYKDEPVFGCHLSDICKGDSPQVPAFVKLCIKVIESKEENMKADGLYRASGNLSQVQKIRLQVDQNNLSMLESEEDVHVLTGALKLFFRELKKPLIPFEYFDKALKASNNQNKKEKLQQFREIVKDLPQANRETLKFLLHHLLKVTEYQESNRMHISNLAIVFGPTLMWPEEESANMALDLMQQNLVIECFLQEFESIFR